MKPCVIIPAYNEAANIGSIIKKVKDEGFEAVVIDDGSQDKTAAIAKQSGAVVLRNNKNQGKGAALLKGFSYALANNFSSVVTIDSDGQHSPGEINKFIKKAKSSGSHIIIGNRMLNRKIIPFLRLATNRFMSWLISFVANQHIPDSQCGFRLIKKEVLEAVKLKSRRYEMESELLIRASRQGFKIDSVHIKTIYRGEKSQIKPFTDTLRFIRFIIAELWTMRS
jgi:glycosyltransferase involved in cell wall biosynthesis